jgi:uncharacterized membrane protein
MSSTNRRYYRIIRFFLAIVSVIPFFISWYKTYQDKYDNPENGHQKIYNNILNLHMAILAIVHIIILSVIVIYQKMSDVSYEIRESHQTNSSEMEQMV